MRRFCATTWVDLQLWSACWEFALGRKTPHRSGVPCVALQGHSVSRRKEEGAPKDLIIPPLRTWPPGLCYSCSLCLGSGGGWEIPFPLNFPLYPFSKIHAFSLLVCVMAGLLLIKLFAKWWEMAQMFGPLPCTWETWMKLPFPGLGMSQHWPSWLCREQENGEDLSFSFPFCLRLWHFFFQ